MLTALQWVGEMVDMMVLQRDTRWVARLDDKKAVEKVRLSVALKVAW